MYDDNRVTITWIIVLAAVLFLLLFIHPRKAHSYEFAQGWTKSDTERQVLFLTLTTLDWRQTHWMAKQKWYWDGKSHKEFFPLFPDHPTTTQVDTFIPLGMVAHTIIALALPPKARWWWQSVFIVIETGATANNFISGVRIEF